MRFSPLRVAIATVALAGVGFTANAGAANGATAQSAASGNPASGLADAALKAATGGPVSEAAGAAASGGQAAQAAAANPLGGGTQADSVGGQSSGSGETSAGPTSSAQLAPTTGGGSGVDPASSDRAVEKVDGSAAANAGAMDAAEQAVGGSSGGGESAPTAQEGGSSLGALQELPSIFNLSIRILSPGDDYVTQILSPPGTETGTSIGGVPTATSAPIWNWNWNSRDWDVLLSSLNASVASIVRRLMRPGFLLSRLNELGPALQTLLRGWGLEHALPGLLGLGANPPPASGGMATETVNPNPRAAPGRSIAQLALPAASAPLWSLDYTPGLAQPAAKLRPTARPKSSVGAGAGGSSGAPASDAPAPGPLSIFLAALLAAFALAAPNGMGWAWLWCRLKLSPLHLARPDPPG